MSISQFFLLTVTTRPIITWPTSGLYGLRLGLTVTNFVILSTSPNKEDIISPFNSYVPVPLFLKC